ncbi:MAG: oligosaccharide flippase family protein [Pelosinus sp.]|nr:oligosaccharide flippase family protein [Pelosinus sp.]
MALQKIKQLMAEYVLKKSFLTNVLQLMTGTAIAQVIPMAISPILTRIYLPEAFGIFALYMAVVAMFSVIVTGRYELAIMLPKQEDDAINIVALSILIASMFSIFTLIFVFFFDKFIINLLGNPGVGNLLYLIPISVFMTGIYQTFNYWSNRKQQYSRLAISRVLQSIITAIANLWLGFIGFGVSGLIIGGILGQIVATGMLVWQVWQEDGYLKYLISRDKVQQNAKMYQDFPKINSIHAFTDIIQSSGILFLISAFFGNTVLGMYSLTMRVLKAPLGLIGASVAQVFYQKASYIYKNNGNLGTFVKQMLTKLTQISVVIFVGTIFFATDAFAKVFGENWREAGNYAQIISPWILLNFIISPLSQIPIIVNKQKAGFCIGMIYNIAILLPMFVMGYFYHDIIKALYMVSLFSAIVLLYYIFWICRISKQ